MTGSGRIPSVGYPDGEELRFELKASINPKPIDIHSCFNQFIINPKLFDDYYCEENKENSALYNLFKLETLTILSNDFSST
jgi:hypothetical protein